MNTRTEPKTLLLLASCLLFCACYSPAPGDSGERKITSNVKDWRDEVIYQVVIDRFSDGDYSNNHGVNRHHLGRYQGGDWRGLIDRIPYLKELGVTTVWISPVVRNLEEDAGFAGYHGYWTQDFTRVNQHFGDLAMMQKLVDRLHEEGFLVILDIVTNHIGQLFYYDINMNGRPDDNVYGGGGSTHGSKANDVWGKLSRVSEWDPDYDDRRIQSFTSLGESGLAPLRWVYQPAINRVPIMPREFQNPNWYHRNGRVTVWETGLLNGYKKENSLWVKVCDSDPSKNTGKAQCKDHDLLLALCKSDLYKDMTVCRYQEKCKNPPSGNPELCTYHRRQEVKGDFPGGLKDMATERTDVQQALIKVFEYWITVGDFDGFRIDTLKHVDHGFWKAFCPAIRKHARKLGKSRFLMFGEAFTGVDELLSAYTDKGQVDSVFYFSQKYRLDSVFKNGQPTSVLADMHADRQGANKMGDADPATQKYYKSAAHPDGVGIPPKDLLVNFLDNHDVARFLHNSSLDVLHVALTYLMTTTGVPCIYYGTEQQFSGGNDPANREVMWRGNPIKKLAPFDTSNATFKHIKKLIQLRKQYAPLRRGTFSIKWSTKHTGAESDAGIFAFERTYNKQTVLVVINAAACSASRKHSRTSYQTSKLISTFAAGTVINVLPDADTGDSFTVGSGGELDVQVPCRGAKILIKK